MADPFAHDAGIATPPPVSCRSGSTASTIPTTGATTIVIVFVANPPPFPVHNTVNAHAGGGQASRTKHDWRRQRRITFSVLARVATD